MCCSVFSPHLFLFFFLDHSNGHDRMRPNGLNMNKVSVRFGGKQPIMRNTEITPGCLGPFHDSTYPLQVGDVQSMQFSDADDGPCYLTPDE